MISLVRLQFRGVDPPLGRLDYASIPDQAVTEMLIAGCGPAKYVNQDAAMDVVE